jgi:DNA-binding NtrC family response regulator
MSPDGNWKVLLVDDDRNSREAVRDWLVSEGLDVVAVGSSEEAVEHIHDGVAVVVTDLKMPRTDGLQLLRLTKEKAPHTAVILISGYGTVDTAVAALKEGAFDFLTKPLNPQQLTHRIYLALEKREMATQIANLHSQLNQRHAFDSLVGHSQPMRELFEKIRLVADTRATVLLSGESGTGKELVARAIHHHSPRSAKPFVPVNCAAIPETLVESELFGHEKGAFTDAHQRRMGLFQAASGGTLFVDEIGELRLGVQSKLLRTIETKKVMPVGSIQEIDVDVRLIAATNRDLEEQVRARQFREDLYFRLKVVELRLPPLRERREDISLLVRYFIEQIARDDGRAIQDIAPEAMEALRSYDWPGNVRELRNTLEGIIVLSMRDQIELADLPEYIRGAQPARAIIQPGMTLEDLEKEAIRRALQQTGGHRAKTAQLLGLSVRTLHRKIKDYNLSVP